MSDTTPPRPSFAAALFGVAAIFLLATGIVAVTVVAANDDDTVDAAAAPATEAAASVSLSEFSIDPDAGHGRAQRRHRGHQRRHRRAQPRHRGRGRADAQPGGRRLRDPLGGRSRRR
jgi:hypothetical protein